MEDNLKVLKETNSEYEIMMIKAILEDNKIPYVFKEKGVGNYMRIIGMGNPIGGKFLLSENDYESAKELIELLENSYEGE